MVKVSLKTKSYLTQVGLLGGMLLMALTLMVARYKFGAIPASEVGIVPLFYFIISGVGFSIAIASVFLASHWSREIGGGE